MKLKNTIHFAILFLISSLTFGQVSYQGPDTGSVPTGALVSTDNFGRILPIGEPTERGIRNVVKVEYNEDVANLIPPAAPEGTNYFEDSNANVHLKGGGNGQTVLLKDFAGISMGNSIPPDPIMAVGPNHILACVNTNFAIWDKQGNLLKNIAADNWYTNVLPNAGAFDPQIIYDHYAGRWFMLWDNQNDGTQSAYFLVSISDDDDPTGVWYNYALPADVMGNVSVNTWGDYPQIGFDEEAIYINSRQFTFGSNVKVYDRIRILDKAEYYAATGGPVGWADIYNISYPGFPNDKPDVIHPSINYSSSSTTYFVHTIGGSTGAIYLYSLTNPLTNPVLTGINIPVTAYGNAPNANQLGGSSPLIHSGGSTMKSSPIFRNGFLWLVHAIRNPTSAANSSIRYYKINVSNNSVIEDITFGAANNWYLYPNLTVDQDQNIAINYTKTSLTEYPSAYYTTRLANDPPGLSGSTLLKEGVGNYVVTFGGERNRWGDYHGIYLDPVTESNIWMFTEYASATNQWGTWLGEIRLVPFPGVHVFTSTNELEFGNIEINSVSDTLSLILSNYGEDILTIGSIADSTGPFKLLTQLSFPLNLDSYDSLTIELFFAPTVPGVFEEILNMVTNDLDFSGVTLKGRGFKITQASTDLLYASSGVNNGGSILTIDFATGTGTLLGPSLFNEVKGISIHPKTKIMYGVVSTSTESELIYFNAEGGDGYVLHSLSVPNFAGISFDSSGTLYGVLKTGELYTIDLLNGDLNLVADANTNISYIAFNLQTNELWATTLVIVGSNKDRIFKIDVNSGDTTVVGNTGFNVNHNALVFDAFGNLYAVTGSATQLNNLIQIDTSSGAGVLIGSVGYSNLTGLAFLSSGPNSVDDNITTIPNEFVLVQNYPNPFNPSTTIEFALPIPADVQLVVYNLLGEVVVTLLNNNLASGYHKVDWNSNDQFGNRVSSGIYFYEMRAKGNNGESYSQFRKMILLK